MKIQEVYLLIHHAKGIDFASGYGHEEVKGFALTKEEAETWVSGLEENGFERRLYRPLERRT